jgi:hypothetical protein
MPTFRNTLSVPSSQASRCVWNELGLINVGVYAGKGLAQAIVRAKPLPVYTPTLPT